MFKEINFFKQMNFMLNKNVKQYFYIAKYR